MNRLLKCFTHSLSFSGCVFYCPVSIPYAHHIVGSRRDARWSIGWNYLLPQTRVLKTWGPKSKFHLKFIYKQKNVGKCYSHALLDLKVEGSWFKSCFAFFVAEIYLTSVSNSEVLTSKKWASTGFHPRNMFRIICWYYITRTLLKILKWC